MSSPDIHSGAPPTDLSEAPSGFPGFGEGAPLDLSGLSDAGTKAVLRRLTDRTFDDWAETAAGVGYCARPVRLVGRSETFDTTTGEPVSSFSSADTPLGVLHRPCGNRRAEVCPSCSRVYARDTFAMIRSGMLGGKTVPDTVADNPLLFVTFTAPSFGHVHGHRNGKRCRPRDRITLCAHGRPQRCMKVHAEDDPGNGAPLCGDCYDQTSAVMWQWWAPELWRRTTIAIRRALAERLGVAERRLKKHASLQYAKVAEYQARGMVHFHALIRLDGADGPGSAAPLAGEQLRQVVEEATRAVTFTVPGIDPEDPARTLSWGRQLDIRTVRQGHRTDDPDGPLAPEQVAGYLAKYATKDANSIRALGQPRAHLVRMAATCRELAGRARAHDRESPYLLLGKWAHMLGFRGHFSTKSRAYSVTLGRLRRARARYQQLVADSKRDDQAREALLDLAELEARLLADDEASTMVVGSWTYQGTGWINPGDEALALAAAARAREYDQWRAAQTK